jgi:hypothetical protein
MERADTIIDFNFTNAQQERFNLLWEETQKVHPKLTKDPVSREKSKVILAHFVINNEVLELNNNEVDVKEYEELGKELSSQSLVDKDGCP